MSIASTHTVPLLDLQAQHESIRGEVLEAILPLIDAQRFILGEPVEKLERAVAAYCGTAHAIGCANGTDALFLALLALEVGPGDEVLTVPFTFFATAGAVVRTGATPVFVDIDPATFNMDPARLEDALKRHPKAKAILPVHLYGACADMDAILALAAPRGIPVVEDAAQAIGAEYRGRRAGSLGAIGCFSFFPSKNLGGYGDGGILTTNDAELAARLKALRVHGSREKYIHEWAGINSRLDALQAAVLLVKLKHLDAWTEGRRANAARYKEMLAGLGLPAVLPREAEHTTKHVYNQFVLRCERRDELRAFLATEAIGTEVYYPLPLHLQKCFAALGGREGDHPVSEACCKDVLALPVYAELTAAQMSRVCGALRRFYGR